MIGSMKKQVPLYLTVSVIALTGCKPQPPAGSTSPPTTNPVQDAGSAVPAPKLGKEVNDAKPDPRAAQITVRVKKIVSEQLGIPEGKILLTSTWIKELGADSLDCVELVMAFEEEFDVEIPDETAEKMATVGDAVNFLVKNAKK
jgi:acyl carrier protein